MKFFITLGAAEEAEIDIQVRKTFHGKAEPTGAELLRVVRLLGSAFAADSPHHPVRTTPFTMEDER